jgi:hypothetical protein
MANDNMSNKKVMTVAQLQQKTLNSLLQHYHLALEIIPDERQIPGSFWGDSEAGLVGNILFVRADTPAHSLLHETCHYICMSTDRREGLHTDAGGDYDEENAVCYLQILLADYLPPLNSERIMADMDSWGYTFRLGAAADWFNHDAEDARHWLANNNLIDNANKPTWHLRD